MVVVWWDEEWRLCSGDGGTRRESVCLAVCLRCLCSGCGVGIVRMWWALRAHVLVCEGIYVGYLFTHCLVVYVNGETRVFVCVVVVVFVVVLGG